ncbi:hypothetical protein B0H10DRAFT_1952943 [Mycena sp. CBHHK59/15]|nr:hypothetical protein B0H10DRAFT_2245679 [Mycena sp. CBHHK59/15]KAJ6611630.1 hypothetical protein B0H10DRAFT_1952943 [Mycena sp. CBHHK59/15]
MPAASLLRALEDIEPHILNLPAPTPTDSPKTLAAWQKLYNLFVGTGLLIADVHPAFPIDLFEARVGDQERDQSNEESGPDADDDDDATLLHNLLPQSSPKERRHIDTEEEQDDMDLDPSSQPDPDDTMADTPEPEPTPQSSPARETPEERKIRLKQAAHSAATKRAQIIIGAATLLPLRATDLADLISLPLDLIAPKAEDEALAHLLRGFKRPSQNWAVTFRHFTSKASLTHHEFCALSRKLDQSPDIVRRDMHLIHTQSDNLSERYLADIVHKVESIKFASEWNKHTGPGSGVYKTRFTTDLFQRANPDIFNGLSGKEKAAKMKDLSGDFILFKKGREPIITARNRLSFCWTNFGTGVLIDPFFCIPNLGEKRAKKFQSLLDVLIHIAPLSAQPQAPTARTIFFDREAENRLVLTTVVQHLAATAADSDALTAWLADFYIRCPSRVQQ